MVNAGLPRKTPFHFKMVASLWSLTIDSNILIVAKSPNECWNIYVAAQDRSSDRRAGL
jgi:hypothetical protein